MVTDPFDPTPTLEEHMGPMAWGFLVELLFALGFRIAARGREWEYYTPDGGLSVERYTDRQHAVARLVEKQRARVEGLLGCTLEDLPTTLPCLVGKALKNQHTIGEPQERPWSDVVRVPFMTALLKGPIHYLLTFSDRDDYSMVLVNTDDGSPMVRCLSCHQEGELEDFQHQVGCGSEGVKVMAAALEGRT